LFERSAGFPEIVRKNINISLVSVIKDMSSQNVDELFKLQENVTTSSDYFYLTMTRVMLETEQINAQTKENLKRIFLEGKLGYNFMVLLVEDLTGEQILENLEKIIDYLQDPSSNIELVKSFIIKSCKRNMLNDIDAKVAPSEFLTRVHLLSEARCPVLTIRKCNL
jgi:hypothetical protein